MIKLGVAHNLKEVIQGVGKIRQRAERTAVNALNATASAIAKAERDEVKRVFDRPTPFTQKPIDLQFAKSGRLEAVVKIKDWAGKGTPASKYLAPQIFGGARSMKRFERSLQIAGVMPRGKSAVFADRSGYIDQYGNLPGPKIVQILSWFKAFPEQGYRANMVQATRNKLLKGKHKSRRNGKSVAMKWGMAYFRGGRNTGLPDGIWERHYPNGMGGKSFIKPVLLYVDGANYSQRFDFFGVAFKTIEKVWAREWAAAWQRSGGL